MADERIHVLRDILLELHNGASPESVQERFDATFAGVSAIEISLMEHELMNSDSGVTFEDVMELCDVHANLFKNAIKGVEVSDTEHPGHPVRVFKEENLALRAALIRIRRLLDTYESMEDEEMLAEMRKGLVRQMGLVGQFDIHYQRKEELFFPIMERYGHDSPPKVMWGVDDQIRELFQTALTIAKSLPEVSISSVKEAFEAFATEFESMIFKEESILLMILLESFTQDDWLQIPLPLRKRKLCWTAIVNRLLVMAIFQSSRPISSSITSLWRLPLSIKMIFSSITMTIRQLMR